MIVTTEQADRIQREVTEAVIAEIDGRITDADMDLEGDDWFASLVIGHDDENPIDWVNDCDAYGRLEWGGRSYAREYDRPVDFDGNAERIDRFNPGCVQGEYVGLWWQPPDDVKRGTAEFEQLRKSLLHLLTYGLYYVKVDVTVRDTPVTCPTCDHTKQDSVSGESSLRGIDVDVWDPDGVAYLKEVAAECVADAIGWMTKETA